MQVSNLWKKRKTDARIYASAKREAPYEREASYPLALCSTERPQNIGHAFTQRVKSKKRSAFAFPNREETARVVTEQRLDLAVEQVDITDLGQDAVDVLWSTCLAMPDVEVSQEVAVLFQRLMAEELQSLQHP